MKKENNRLIHLRLPESLIKKIDEEAKKQYANRTEMVKQILLKYFASTLSK